MTVKIDNDATSGSKLLRLLFILISDDKEHFLSDLSKKLNCSRQTVIRLSTEIESVMGNRFYSGMKYGKRYYKNNPNITLGNLVPRQNKDLRYLNLCRELVDEFMPDQVKKSLDNFLLEYSISKQDLSNPFTSDEAKGHFSFYSKGYIDYTPHFEKIQMLLDAIESKQILSISYKAAGKKELRHHLFAPARILSMSGALYVFGALTSDLKTLHHYCYFSIHRIYNINKTNTKRTFPIPVSNLKLFGLKWHDPVTYRILFKDAGACDYIRERIFAENQRIIENPDGSIFLEITTCSSPELFAFVRSFGLKARLFNDKGEEINPLTEELMDKKGL